MLIGLCVLVCVFIQVIDWMEFVVECECCECCQQLINCDFQFVVDDREGLELNVFQIVDDSGCLIIGFMLLLIGVVCNQDELVFVVGYEVSYYIFGYIICKSSVVIMGVVIFGGLVSVYGGNSEVIESVQ